MITRTHEISTEQFVAEVTYETGTTAFGYADTREQAIQEATIEIFGQPVQTLVFRRTERTKQKRICGSTRTFQVYELAA